MKTYSPRYVPRTYATDKSERRAQLAARLEACADRICDYQDRLMADAATMKPIELERLMDEYRAEQVRYDHIDRELQAMEEPKKTETFRKKYRDYVRRNREKINY